MFISQFFFSCIYFAYKSSTRMKKSCTYKQMDLKIKYDLLDWKVDNSWIFFQVEVIFCKTLTKIKHFK